MEHFIPDRWFSSIPSDGMLLLVVVVAIAVLVKGADLLVEGAARLAVHLGIGKVIVGATVVSLGTTSPEAAVSVMAAWAGKADLALGNAIGSIVCDTALIFGLCCVLTRLPLDRFVLDRHGWLQLGSGVLLALVCVGAWIASPEDPRIPRSVGLLFLLLLGAYLALSVRWARQHRQLEEAMVVDELAESDSGMGRDAFLVVLGLAIVILSSRVLIGSASELALRWEVPKAVVAATLVAFGTSLPELVTGLTAIYRGHKELVIGNVVGADILNVLFVIGASAVATPLDIDRIFFWFHLPVMLAVLVVFRIYIFVGRGEFSRWMGIPLLGAYAAYVVAQYFV